MGNFNAGAIEGTLTLDRSAFSRELKQAQAEARKFEQTKITIGVKLGDIAAELKKLQAETKNADDTIKIDTEIKGEEKIRRFREQVRLLGGEAVNISVESDKNGEIQKLRVKLKSIPDETVKVNVKTDPGDTRNILGSTRALNGMRFAVAGVAAILPTLGPVAGGAAAALMGIAGAAGIVALGIGAFAIVAIPALDRVKKALAEVDGNISKLPPHMQAVARGQAEFKKAQDALGKNAGVYLVIGAGFSLLAQVMTRLTPVIDAVSDTFLDLLLQLGKWVSSPAFSGVVDFVANEFGPTFKLLAAIIGNVVRTFGSLTAAFQPFTKDMLGGLAAVTDGWAEWAATLAQSDGFQKFIGFIQENGPKVLQVFVALGAALINIGVALAPLAGPVLDTLISVFSFIANLPPDLLGAILVGVAAAIVLFQAWTAAVAVFNLVMAANPIALVVIAIAALAAAFVFLFKNNKTFHDFVVNNLWPAVKGFAQFLYGAFRGIVMAVGAAVTILVTLVRTWINVWGSTIRGGVAVFQSVVRGGWAVVTSVWKTAIGTIQAATRTFWSVISTAFTTAVGILKTIVSTAWAVIKAAFTGNFASIPGIVSGGWKSITGKFTDGVNSIKTAVKNGLDDVLGLFRGLGGTIAGAVGDLGGVLVSAGSSIISGLISGIKSMIPNVTGVLQGITSKLPDWKGPRNVDMRILRPSGRMVLDGFIDGLLDKIPDIKDLLGQTTKDLGSATVSPMQVGMKASAPAQVAATPGITRDEFLQIMMTLIDEMRANTQPLIGEYNDASKDPREIAEEWWLIAKGRGF